jgi:hypothetical protein
MNNSLSAWRFVTVLEKFELEHYPDRRLLSHCTKTHMALMTPTQQSVSTSSTGFFLSFYFYFSIQPRSKSAQRFKVHCTCFLAYVVGRTPAALDGPACRKQQSSQTKPYLC